MYNLYKEKINAYICLRVITFFLGVPILVMGIWLSKQLSTNCESFLNIPIITLGALITFFCLMGICWAQCQQGTLLCCHGFIMFALLCTLLGYSIFALVVSANGGGEPLPRIAYKEYRLEDYSHWLQKRVNGTKTWINLKSCLIKSHVCSDFYAKYANYSQAQFFSTHLSSIQSGCCKPPNDCNFNYTNPTDWIKPKESNYSNPDCYAWANDQNVLCFNCQSCKAGLADGVKSNWHEAGIICIVFVVLMCIFSFMGCLAIES